MKATITIEISSAVLRQYPSLRASLLGVTRSEARMTEGELKRMLPMIPLSVTKQTLKVDKEWSAGRNIPGCLPDVEPAVCESYDAAVDVLAGELETAHIATLAESREVGGEEMRQLNRRAQEYAEAAAQVRAKRGATEQDPFWLRVGNYAWWVAQEQ